jgi:hypothetical protein
MAAIIGCTVGIAGLAPAAAQPENEPVIYLNQAWSPADSERYGLITQPANPETNPDGLPIGISKTVVTEARWKGQQAGEFAGLTCAACHEGQLNYKGKHIRIEGGVGNMFDIMAYIGALNDAMQAPLADTAKFDRLAARIGATNQDAKNKLRERFTSEAAKVHEYQTRTVVTPVPWGPSRMDAIALIVNRVTSVLPGIPENWSTPLAPTKPPFLWNSPQGLWTQWRAVQQDPIDRNLTETMGVYMSIDLQSKAPAEGLFQSNARIANLQKVEDQLTRLAPPSWPEDVFGKIDRDKARAGKALFVQYCASCHNAWPYTWTEPNKYGKRFILVGLTPQKYVGTDPGQFDDIRPYAITAQLSDYLPGELRGKQIVPTGYLYRALSGAVLETALATVKLSDEQTADLHGYRELPIPPPPEGVYKAAPRDGVWATPPFMHNGSVPNLYEMLLPAAERTKKFHLGREFDPVKVGLDTSGNSSGFLIDTTLRGNTNAGHSFEDGPRGNGVIGPLLTDDQRWALVEYLKSIPEEPGRVTPFGGPTAH